jgi:hypothetical protein
MLGKSGKICRLWARPTVVDVEFRRGLLLPNEGPRKLGRYREKNGLPAGSACAYLLFELASVLNIPSFPYPRPWIG